MTLLQNIHRTKQDSIGPGRWVHMGRTRVHGPWRAYFHDSKFAQLNETGGTVCIASTGQGMISCRWSLYRYARLIGPRSRASCHWNVCCCYPPRETNCSSIMFDMSTDQTRANTYSWTYASAQLFRSEQQRPTAPCLPRPSKTYGCGWVTEALKVHVSICAKWFTGVLCFYTWYDYTYIV